MKEQLETLAKKYDDSGYTESNYYAFIAGANAQKELMLKEIHKYLKESTYNANGRLTLYKSTFVELFEDLKDYLNK